MFIHIIKTWNSKEKNSYKKINEIVYSTITLTFGIYYPFIILKFGDNLSGFLFPDAIEELTLLGNICIFGVMMGIIGWAISAKIRTIRNPKLLEDQNNYDRFCESFLRKYSNLNQLKRKLTHLIPFGVVCIVIIVCYFLKFIFQERWLNYALFFIVIIGADFAFTFLIADLIRLLDFSFMPPNAIKLCDAGLTPDELDSFASTSVMVFGFGPFILFRFPIFLIVLLISSVADAMASIFGILASNKKHIFPTGTEKSIEGYIGGFLFTFLSTLFAGLFSNIFDISIWSLDITLILALILSIIFVFIDLFTSKIKLQDNYLNPIIIGIFILIYLNFLKISLY